MKIPVKPKEYSSSSVCCEGDSGETKENWPKLSVDIPSDLEHNMVIGDEVTLTVKGRVVRVSQAEDQDWGNYIEIEMRQADVEKKKENVFSDLADD